MKVSLIYNPPPPKKCIRAGSFNQSAANAAASSEPILILPYHLSNLLNKNGSGKPETLTGSMTEGIYRCQ